jgi:endonuclease V-like protein UPF0215 family
VKPGTRALGIAESFSDGPQSTLGGAVVRVDRVVEGFEFNTCTVGGIDATEAVATLWTRLNRLDVRWLLLAGIAPAWFNILDICTLASQVDRPVVAVTFEDREESLTTALGREFSGEALSERRAMFERQPPRRRITVKGGEVYIRAAGCSSEEATEVIKTFTHEDGRPEPLRVAKTAAWAADAFRRRED